MNVILAAKSVHIPERSMRKILLCLALLMMAAPAVARMYQWVDPETHTPQLSGKPPTWYRSSEGGPRVFVIDNGRVVDDTAVPVSDSERERLRENALAEVERDRETARRKLLEAEQLKASMDGGARKENPEPEPEAAPPEAAVVPPAPQAPASTEEDETMRKMRALVEQWEKVRTQDARQVVDGGSGTPPAPAAAKP